MWESLSKILLLFINARSLDVWIITGWKYEPEDKVKKLIFAKGVYQNILIKRRQCQSVCIFQ